MSSDEAEKNEQVVSHILGLYRLDKLCPKCNGPMEKLNTVHCEMCDLKMHLKVYVTMIETAAMNITYEAKLNIKEKIEIRPIKIIVTPEEKIEIKKQPVPKPKTKYQTKKQKRKTK